MGGPICIAGPTASGKSAVAIKIAERLQGEIISVDSMQVYRGLDIGTAKPSEAEQAGIPHHVIDCAGLEETYDAARFVREATAAERKIERPIYCGGTGLYFQAWLEGLGEFMIRTIRGIGGIGWFESVRGLERVRGLPELVGV